MRINLMGATDDILKMAKQNNRTITTAMVVTAGARVYNNEKTLCDILRPNSSVDIQIISESFKR